MTWFVYLSNALSGTISHYQFDQGRLVLVDEIEVGYMVMPMTISQCQHFLYAAVRSEPYRVIQFRIDPQTGKLGLESEQEVDESIVSLDSDSNNQWLLAASFNQNRLSVKRLSNTGQILSPAIDIQHRGHCHMFGFSPCERWMVATEFGRDKIYVYASPSADTNPVEPVFEYQCAKDSGPRHIVFSQCGAYLYVLTEMNASVMTFSFEQENGSLSLIAETTVLPLKALGLERGLPPSQRVANDVPRAWAADIHLTQNGRFLYVSERTLSLIACLEISGNDPVPRYVSHHSVEAQPRSFMITDDDKYMLVSGELAKELGAYAIDSTNGTIRRISAAPCGDGAAWVCATRVR